MGTHHEHRLLDGFSAQTTVSSGYETKQPPTCTVWWTGGSGGSMYVCMYVCTWVCARMSVCVFVLVIPLSSVVSSNIYTSPWTAASYVK